MVKPYMNSSEPPIIYVHTVCLHIVTYIMYICTYNYMCDVWEESHCCRAHTQSSVYTYKLNVYSLHTVDT